MKDFCSVLGGVLVGIGVLGGLALFYELAALEIPPELRWGLALGTALSCCFYGAVLLGMASGLDLLEAILSWVREPEGADDRR